MIAKLETVVVCVTNDGESRGLPISNFLKKGKPYFIRNIKLGALYNQELIAEVYDAKQNRIKLSEDVSMWRIDEYFAPSFQYSLN